MRNILRESAVVLIALVATISKYLWENRENIAFLAAWGLITWAIVQFSMRGWAMSIGIYFLLYAFLGIFPSIVKTISLNKEIQPKHPHDA